MARWSRRLRRRTRRQLREFRERFPAFLPVAIGGGIFLVIAGLFILSALSTRKDLNYATLHAQVLQQSIIDGNKATASESLKALQDSARSAHEHSDGLMWKIASRLPWAGDDVLAVRKVAIALDESASSALPPVVDVATQLDLNNFAPKNGKVDLKLLATLNDPIAESNESLAAQKRLVESIDLDGLVGPVRAPVENFVNRVSEAAVATSITHNALELMPSMLGDEKRTYLLVFQNNAEVRSTGGLPGSYLLMNVKEGKISRGEQGAGSGIDTFSKAVTKLTKEERDLYTNLLGKVFIDSNFTPEFPRTAAIMKAMIKEAEDVDIDGVISVDPVTMAYVLEGTGPVKLDDGTQLTSGNAVKELINEAYFRYPDAEDSDDFFEDAAARIFDFVTDGRGDSGTVIRNLVRAAKERRLYMWSADAAEQSKLTPTDVSGAITPDSGTQPSMGIFLNDATGTKLEYYLEQTSRVRSIECRDDGVQTIDTTVTLTSNAPANAASFPPSIVTSRFGVEPGLMQMNLRVYLPTGAKLVSSRINSTTNAKVTQPHRGHGVVTIPVTLRPGQSSNVKVVFTTAPGQSDTIRVASTPGVQPVKNTTVTPTACSS